MISIINCLTRIRKSLLLGAYVATTLTSQLVLLPTQLFASANTWVDGALPSLSVNSVTDNSRDTNCVQTAFRYYSYTNENGNYDAYGRTITTPVCAYDNGLGSFGSPVAHGDDYSFIRPNTSMAFRVLRETSEADVTPVPNQSVFMYKDSTHSAYGEFAPHLYTSFLSAGTFGKQYDYVSGRYELAYQLRYDTNVLKDTNGNTLYVHAYTFSNSGEWMVAEVVGLGLVRINVLDHSIQLFDALQRPYYLGFRPQLELAISDDGTSVLKSGAYAGDTTTYDLSACLAAPFVVNGDNTSAMQGCRSRDVQQSLRDQLDGFDYLLGPQFDTSGQVVT